MENVSAVTMFTLSGLKFTYMQRMTLFVVTLLWYILILLSNISMIVVIVTDKTLHQPMYVFLCNLCINAVYGATGFYPKFLKDLLSTQVISYAGCMLQGYVIHSSSCCDFSILTVMAYDRYVAICRPLVYHTLMSKQRVSLLVFFSWFVPLYCMFMNTATLLGKELCGSHINKLYCVNWMVSSLACAPLNANGIVTAINLAIYFGHFLFILWSYLYLMRVCISSREMWIKFMQTCFPHLICLLTFAVTLLLDIFYMRFGSADLPQDPHNFMTILFLLINPVVNPLIYGFKLTGIRNRVLSILHFKKKMSTFAM
ncbi:olfactory receptor 2A7-like [Nerophis ophidion]|uniref:olfactory receptor 2A7-like n=1 Tax=Nerophis ophidion TaxID=159077 RepID=UPI002AE026B1|nr:olfactory receptor 2A7-like [Nerophis ophidion]XP_061775396.1 olfactory receptor 2A7-like [Nerophis ophidion]